MKEDERPWKQQTHSWERESSNLKFAFCFVSTSPRPRRQRKFRSLDEEVEKRRGRKYMYATPGWNKFSSRDARIADERLFLSLSSYATLFILCTAREQKRY
jgi:hypothetical protein